MVCQRNCFSLWSILCAAWIAAALLLPRATSAQLATDDQPDKEVEAAAKNLKVLQAIFELPDDEIDLARVKLTIDQMIDRSIDVEHALKQIDAMVSTLQQQFPFKSNNQEKLEALRRYLHQPGPWNDARPFSYDLDDPFGHNLNNKLLTSYLSTRKGNCVSMPVLFVILGQRIGRDVTLAAAPEHIFVKYRDEAGNLYNLETTSGAEFARDVWIRQSMPMTDEAIAKGAYMRPLSKREAAVLMSNILSEFYAARNQELERAHLAQLQLKHDPISIMAVLNMASVYSKTLSSYRSRMLFMALPDPNEEREIYIQLQQKLNYWHAQALALGWRHPDDMLKNKREDESQSHKTMLKKKQEVKQKSIEKP